MDWLRPLLSLFYAPQRAMAEARDRAPLGPAVALAFAGQVALLVYLFWPYMFAEGIGAQQAGNLFSVVRKAVESILIVAVGFVPTTIFVANLLERRGSFGVALAQEYASIASAVFYVRAGATLVGLLLAILSRVGGR